MCRPVLVVALITGLLVLAKPGFASEPRESPTDSELRSKMPELVQTPTGDALFDAYAEAALGRLRRGIWNAVEATDAVVDQLGLRQKYPDEASLRAELGKLFESENLPEDAQSRMQESGDLIANFAILPRETLVSMEAEFGADPRYWQLWSVSEGQRFMTSEGGNIARFNPEVFRPLIAAHQHGIADAQCYFMLRSLLNAASEHYAQQQMDMRKRFHEEYEEQKQAAIAAGENPEDVYQSEDWAELTDADIETDWTMAKAMQMELGLGLEELLSAAIAADPQQAIPYYTRSAEYARQGRFREALDDLVAGNAAPKCETLRSFPCSVTASDLKALNVNPILVNGANLMLRNRGSGIGTSSVGISAWRKDAAIADPLLRLEYFRQAYQACLRQASTQGQDLQGCDLSLIIAHRLLDEFKKQFGAAMSTATVAELDAHSTQIRQMISGISECESSSFGDWSAAFSGDADYSNPLTLADWVQLQQELARLFNDRDAIERKCYIVTVLPQIRALPDFDPQALLAQK